jgi:hypothetical protein
VLRFSFNEDGSFNRYSSAIANGSGIIRAFVENDENYTNAVYTGIRRFGFSSQ